MSRDIEASLKRYVEQNKPVPHKLAKQIWDLHYAQKKTEADPLLDEMVNLFRLFIKAKTISYFEKAGGYCFNGKKAGTYYSLYDWLTKFFNELQEQAIDVRERKDFLIFIANSLQSYIGNSNISFSHFRICVIAGYIGCMFGHLNTEEVFLLRPSSYPNYHNYLFKKIDRIWTVKLGRNKVVKNVPRNKKYKNGS